MKKYFLFFWGLATLCVCPLVTADDITRDLRQNTTSPNSADGGYFELGIGLGYFVDPFIKEDDCDSREICPALLIGGAYHFRNAFIEFADATFDGLNIGYTLAESPRWAIDLIVANIFGDIDGDLHESDDPEEQKNLDLIYRSRLVVGSGARVTGYFGNTIVQLRWVTDLLDEHGTTSSLRVGRSWQYRNWNFHALLSADWFSSRMANYWVGVEQDEATTRFPVYTASSSAFFSGEVGVAYPLAEHWVARSYWRYSPLPSDISDSPLVDEDYASLLGVAVSYAF